MGRSIAATATIANKQPVPRRHALKLPSAQNILNGVLTRYYALTYNQDEQDRTRHNQFASLGLDCNRATDELNAALRSIGWPDFDASTGSVHWLLASGLAQVIAPKRILEIGTFEGQFTRILATLFPEADVVTVDLPPDDPSFRSSYGRDTDAAMRRHIAARSANLARPNIHHLQTNSFQLLDHLQPGFDLILVDGDHLLPAVAWDLAIAHHLARPGGYVMCDDVIIHPRGLRDDCVSPDSNVILSDISHRGNFTVHRFLKRLSPKWSARPTWRKFVAIYRKP